MRLSQLEAEFLKYLDDGRFQVEDVSFAEADGIWFVCPKCYQEAGKREGVHSVICWFKGCVPDSVSPGPGRWNPSGTGMEDLTFVGPGAVSVLLIGGCGWHGFITNGDAT